MVYEDIKVGADPELFLVDYSGKFISSVGLIGGTKEHPLPIDDKGHCLQEDNVSVEFNIAPASSKQDFINSLTFVLDEIESRASSMQLLTAIVPAAEFDFDQLQTPQAMTFGCEPDYNAWTGDVNPAPYCDNMQLRSAGGHIHVGYKNPTKKSQRELVKAMDIFLGVPSAELDPDNMRRQLYGKPGAMRFKKYGAEYRTLSNFWIKTKELQEWAYDQTMRAIDFLNNGGTIDPADNAAIYHAIMFNDKQAQALVYNKYGV